EPGAGSDVAGMSTSAKKAGNDYILNGEKSFITNASHSKMFVVFATHDRSRRDKGISTFVVPSDAEGLSIGKKEHKMGQRASNTASVIFKDVRVPAEDRLGNEGDGFKIAMRTLDHSRPLVAIAAVGLARSAMEYSIKYAAERKQFDQPIASFQAIQFMIADMAKDIEASRWLTYYSSWLLDHNRPSTLYSSMAKCMASDVAMRVTTDAVQIFGGYGYSREFPVEKLMRDAKLLQIYEGTNQIQRLVIAKNLLSVS
ncbi:MAG: acyl-CoA dehydrogenase family protein, partial [Deltaproteobacteria bacterium]|nr:acyl-CoA dehydrogenase family protein [Deltaproteobacteria bacterium]